MSRRHSITKKIILALLISGFPLLIACDQELDFQPPENEHTKENATQDSKPTPNAPAGNPSSPPVAPSEPSTPPENADSTVTGDGNEGSAGTTDNSHAPSPDDSNPDVPGNITPPAEDTNDTSNVTPPAGGDADSTVTGDSTAEQKVAPWSDPEDYEYYSKLPFKNKEYESIKNLMRQQIVPQAVEALLRTFPKTFGYLRDWAIGFGLNVTYMGYQSELEAAFNSSLHTELDEKKSSHSDYGLMINMAAASIDLQDGGELTEEKRIYLEKLCVHELMHAMMHETLTCGMSGYIPSGGNVDEFPGWFKEGTAEAACGSRLSKIIQVGDDTEQIKKVLQQYTLTANNTTSEYTVGWFAVMYLASLVDGKNSVIPDALAKGLDTFLYEIHSGTSLSDAIKKYSSGVYSDLKDFENKFVSDDNVASFIKELVTVIDKGQGSLVAGDFGSMNLLPDEECKSMLFWIYTENDQYTNRYGNALNIKELLEGGAATYTGEPGAAVKSPSPEVLE